MEAEVGTAGIGSLNVGRQLVEEIGGVRQRSYRDLIEARSSEGSRILSRVALDEVASLFLPVLGRDLDRVTPFEARDQIALQVFLLRALQGFVDEVVVQPQRAASAPESDSKR